jgi:hypothetical protein
MSCSFLFLCLLPGPNADAGAADIPVDAEAAYELLKDRLVGEWVGEIVHSAEPVEASFYLTGNDSAVVEYIRRPQRPAASMSTVYHLADEHLQLTHYCSFMNQPRLRAASISPDGKTINFGILDVSNLSRSGNRYTYKMRIAFPAPDKAEVTYVGLADGDETGQLTVALTRVE